MSLMIFLLSIFMIVLCALLHYEGLKFLSNVVFSHYFKHRIAVLVSVLFCILLHLIEVFIYGLMYSVLSDIPNMGYIHSAHTEKLFDYVYFSGMTYSSIGFGDMVPTGMMRLMVSTEGITGLVLIGWSASFTYLQMQKKWIDDPIS